MGDGRERDEGEIILFHYRQERRERKVERRDGKNEHIQ